MQKKIKNCCMCIALGLFLFGFSGLASADDSNVKLMDGNNTIIKKTSPGQTVISPESGITAVSNLAKFSITDFIEILADGDTIASGTYSGRIWGNLKLENTIDDNHLALGTITETMEGDSFIAPEFPENATWDSTHINWVFPRDFTINESESLSSVYNTNSYTSVNVPVTLTRYLNQSVFSSNGYQFNSYTVQIEDNSYNHFTGRIAYEETNSTNSSLFFDTFTTDLPLTSLTKNTYLHPITNQYISDIYFELNSSLIQIHHPYHFNFTGNISLKNNQGLPVKISPRIFYALDQWRSPQAGDVGTTAVLPSSLLPAQVTYASASTNVSNLWTYLHNSQLKVIFKQQAQLLKADKIGIYKDGAWYLDNDGSGTWNTGDRANLFGATGWTSVVGDWNGDGKTDIGVMNGQVWYLDMNNNGAYDSGVDKVYSFGAPGWRPVVGDWNATGNSSIGVTNGQTWYLDGNGNGAFDAGTDKAYSFGAPGWTPIAGDWNHDGKTEIGVTNGQQWYLDWNGNGAFDAGTDKAYSFGAPGWTPIVGDWNAIGKSNIGVTNGQQWYLDGNGNGAWDGTDKAYSFGAPGWTPIVGDWNATGNSYIGVTNGQTWYLDWNGNGAFDTGVDKAYSFGAPGWTPILGKWN